jgi:SAM-dependent methyltransferase
MDYLDIGRRLKEAAKTAAATKNSPEAKLRELVAPIWDEYIKERRLDLHFHPRDERSFANGRADTVFNRLILEYKKPGAIKSDNAKNRQLIAQVKGYIEDLAKEERWKEDRLLGVAFDGDHFLFIRRVGRWVEEEPLPVSPESIERFFFTLEKLTSKAALVPDNLIRDFAVSATSQNYIASRAIQAFYFALTKNVNERVKVFFEQWSTQFAEVHGAIEDKKFNAETLFKSYGFKKEDQKDFNFLAFFFALDTYYALLMKLLSYQVVGFYALKEVIGLPLIEWGSLDSSALKDKIAEMEEGGIFRQLGIRNFLEGDLLSWYLNDWNETIEMAIRDMIKRLNNYDPETMEILPDETRDILKKLYQFLVPKEIRHDLGEYYTPDWLAERCLNQVGYGVKESDLLTKRLLDPGCGSGTFLILAIKRAKENARIKGIDPSETLSLITRNIVGFDLNPLAVISARTNYLLAVADLLKYKKSDITIPVYLCDSINPPSVKKKEGLFDEGGYYLVSTSVGSFAFPNIFVKRGVIAKVINLLEDSVKKSLDQNKFIERAINELNISMDDASKKHLETTYASLLHLEQKGINGIWARIIKNAFAPLFMGEFDFVVGNPPWVNWSSLPKEYRNNTIPIWQKYGLFEHKGLDARLGKACDDISILMVYVAIDRYLRNKAKLCFVITQTVFKTVGGGEGFRRFQLGPEGIPFNVIQVDDMVDLQPFDAATNRTAVFICQKGEQTKYPVHYALWKKKEKGSIDIDYSWGEVQEKTLVKYLKAQSINASPQGPWITAKPKGLLAIPKVIGKAAYKGRMGAHTGGANGLYWVDVNKAKNQGDVEISNFYDIGKIKYAPVTKVVEKDLVYPLLRGRDTQKWLAKPSLWIVLPQNLSEPNKAYSETILKKGFPKTFEYFELFKKELLERTHYKAHFEAQGAPYYSIYNVGAYTLSPYKLVWRYIASEMTCAVVGQYDSGIIGPKNVIPDTKLVLVSFDSEDEAHYACSVLNSSPVRFVVDGYGVSTQLAPHILNNVSVPQYNSADSTHRELASCSKECHKKVLAGIEIGDIEAQIDELSAQLWGLTKEELADIKESLEETS